MSGRQAPARVRLAGVLVALQGAVGAGVVVRLIVLGFAGSGDSTAGSAFTTLFLLALAILTLVAGIALYRGRWWPRPVAVLGQILLLTGGLLLLATGHLWFGVPLTLMAVGVLVGLCSPKSNQWMAVPFDLTSRSSH